MSSDIIICNLALSHIGSESTIASLTEESTEAEQCNIHYATALKETLEKHDWSFARNTVTLTLKGTAPAGWDYQYATPNNMVRPLHIHSADVPQPWLPTNEGLVNQLNKPIPFQKRYNESDNSVVIVTNLEDALLTYTHLVTNPVLFPASFTISFSYHLAERISMPLTRNPEIKSAMREQALVEVSTASANDKNSEQPPPAPDSAGVRARG